MKRFFFTCLLCLFLSNWSLFSESPGASQFKKNKPAAAIPMLEAEIANGTAESEDYNFLGLAYYQLGNYEKSLEAFEAGFLVAGTNKRIIAYNAGNTAFAMQDYEKADEYFSLALIADPDFKEAILNRANARLRQSNYSGALEDYNHFMEIAADDINAPTVSQMIIVLTEEVKKREGDELLEAELERRRQEREQALDHEMVDDNEIPSDKNEESGAENAYGNAEAVNDEQLDDGMFAEENDVADDSENSVSSEAVNDEPLDDGSFAEENNVADDLENSVSSEAVNDEPLDDGGFTEENNVADDLEKSVSSEAVSDEPLDDGVFAEDSAGANKNGSQSDSTGQASATGDVVPEKLDDDMLWLPD